MGYELHITRRENWADEGDDISREEINAVVEADPELEWDASLGEDMIRYSGNSKYDDPWLWFWEGAISTKWPDEALILKMIDVSLALNANVQGDDGERYSNASDIPKDWDKTLFS